MPVIRPGKAGNLPGEVVSFVGRREELGQVRRLLAEFRLVTLTGAGGTGKTRLATRAAANLRRAFSDGVWFVDLTELRDPGFLDHEIQDPDVLALLVAGVLGLRDQDGDSPLRALVDQLAHRRLLLILDNCEHVIPGCAILIDTLLRACRWLSVLATSREPLMIGGEALLPVPPLPVPDAGRSLSLAEVFRFESVLLFVARAEAALPGFRLTEDNRVAVAGLCQQLDGLPLAIELAAARIRVLAPEQMLDRMADRFALLSRGSRNVPNRQQTLRRCVEWSFDLCTKPERTMWARLSVFAGGFELDAVEGVCADERVPAGEVFNLLAGLVDKSIISRHGRGEAAARYRMLETMRAFGQDRLIETDERLMLWRRHRDWCERLVAQARAEWASERQAYWLIRLGREHPNIRAALEFCLTQPDDVDAALRIVTAIPQHYWWTRGVFGEGRRWLDRALTLAAGATVLHTRALLINSQLAFGQGDREAGVRLLDEGEDIARRSGIATEISHAGYIRGVGALFGNDLPGALHELTRAWMTLSTDRQPDLDLRMNLLIALAVAASLDGDRHWADIALREMRAIVESRKGAFHQAAAQWAGAVVAWAQGDLAQAAIHAVENLRLGRAWAAENPNNVAVGLEVLAWVSAGRGQHRRAATLLGAADNSFADSGGSITAQGHFVGPHDTTTRQVRDVLGDAAFRDAFRQGRTLTTEQVFAYALGEARPTAPAPGTGSPLTRRERQVAELVAEGLSNKDVAAALVISQRTAESHVEHIMTKLGFTSRAQVAAWIAAQPTDAPQ